MVGIYKIENLINGKIYIGQSQNIIRRWNEHRNFSYRPELQHKPLYQDFIKYGLKNFSFEVVEECSIDLLDEREKYWIEYYNSCYFAPNSNGYNLNYGGGKYNAFSSETLDKMVELWNQGLTTTQIGEKLSCTKRSVRYCLKELCPNYSEDEGRERGKNVRELGKKVNQYTLDGKFIRQFNNGQEAAKENNIDYSTFKRAVSGKFFQCGGHIYIYDNEDQEIELQKRFELLQQLKDKNEHYHAVEQYNLATGETIATFDSYTTAAKTLFYPAARRYIGECCRGLRKQYQGYGWRDKK